MLGLKGNRPRPCWWLGALTVLAAAAGVWAQPRGILDVGAERANRAVITMAEALPELTTDESDMTRLLRGVLADLRGKGLDELRACVPANPMLGDASSDERVCVIHLVGGRGQKKVAVVQGADGNFVAVEIGVEGKPRRAELRREQFAALIGSWPQYRGSFDGAVIEARGEVFELEQPYVPGRFTMDQKTLGDRFLNGGRTNLQGMDRVLADEKLLVRLPRGYDPRSPAGLVVWVDPGPNGRPPASFHAALDELGLICVGAAGAGNNRQVANREQLALDGIATVSRRFHVDPRRVYITGVSGGGRVSSMMVACFPDVFAGAVPIVGLACFQPVPDGVGGAWARGYERPKAEMWKLAKSRRIAAITGQKDFNEREMQNATNIMQKEGMALRLYDFPDMGHEAPTPERFLEAMKWVDEPYRTQREIEIAAARKAMESYDAKEVKSDDAAKKLLYKATAEGPWTEAARRAAELLGLVKK